MDARHRTVIRAIIKALRAGRHIEDADDMLAYATSFSLPPHAGLHRNDLACMLLQEIIGDTPTSILDKKPKAGEVLYELPAPRPLPRTAV